MKPRSKLLLISTMLIVVAAASIAMFFMHSWHSADAVMTKLVSEPGTAFSENDTQVLLKYMECNVLYRRPWDRSSPKAERALIKACIERIKLGGDIYPYAILVTKWKYYGEFAELPDLAGEFLDNRDDAAATVISYTEGPVPGSLLGEDRVRQLLNKPGSETFQVALVAICPQTVFQATQADFIKARDQSQLTEKAWQAFERRRKELGGAKHDQEDNAAR